MYAYYDKERARIPIKMWIPQLKIEPGAWEQLIHLANLPFAFSHIAVMPDTHQGYGMPIGAVLATEKVIIPNAVGVDIGCGMCAVKTPWKVNEVDIETTKKIMSKIRETVPVGFNHHKVIQDKRLMPTWETHITVIDKEYQAACYQLGTLGGGNHFIELQKDTDGFIWIMLHSGSRNLGKKVADYYNRIAVESNTKWFAYVPKEWELAFLPLDSKEGQDYLNEMKYCVDFALANRKLMMERIAEAFNSTINFKKINMAGLINIAHNYAEMENHFGKNVMVHRKGATLVREGIVGIIPGSQGTKSYIVTGLGNPESFMSCSHGAGRKMGRGQAQRELDLATEVKKLNDQGIIHGIRSVNDLDEAAGAYKDIDEVMENQKELVQISVELSPLAVIKGD
jgi:tRNA-splicing ligase RtcB